MSEINFDSSSTSDPTTGIFIGIGQTRINLLKEVLEDLCIDLGPTDNTVDYKNYLISNPIVFYTPGSDSLSESEDFNLNGGIGGGNSINGVYIPESVKRNQRIGKCPQDFINGVTAASKETGIPVSFYIAFGALESGWMNCRPNSSGYGGYFGQKPSQGGTGSVYQQAKGIMVDIYKNALKDAKQYGFNNSDLAVWCYLCHNAGNAGARTMLNALGGKLRHSNIEAYENAARAFVSKYGSRWSAKTQQSQIREKTLSIPKAYYVISQI